MTAGGSQWTKDLHQAVARAESLHPELGYAVQAVRASLVPDPEVNTIHQTALQQFLWWYLPRQFDEDTWPKLAEACEVMLRELGLTRLADIAGSDETATVFAAWSISPDAGAKAFDHAHSSSGVAPPDTPTLAWGSVFGADEAAALETVERTLGDAVESGELQPGKPRWRTVAAAITERTLTQPLYLPPGQSLAGLVTTERVSGWIRSARHPLQATWRSAVANQLLNPVPPPIDPAAAIAPLFWLLELAAAPTGVELTQSHYLARSIVVEAVERFGWWDWPTPPRSEADVPQLVDLRQAMARLRLVRRRGTRWLSTIRGSALLADPPALWTAVATETEDGDDFTRMVTELVGLRLCQGPVERDALGTEIAPILAAQGWTTGGDPIVPDEVGYAIWSPIRWWHIFGTFEHLEAAEDRGIGCHLVPNDLTLTPDGTLMVLAYLRARALRPLHSLPI